MSSDALGATLNALVQMTTTAPEKLHGILEEAEQVKTAADALKSEVDEQRAHLAATLEQIHGAIGDLEKDAEARQRQVDEEIAAVATALDSLGDVVTNAHTQLDSELQAVKTGIDELNQHLGQASQSAVAVGEQTQAALARAHDAIASGQAGLEAALELATHEIDALKQEVDTAKRAVDQHVDQLSDHMKSAQQDVEAHLKDVVQHFASINVQFHDALQGLVKDTVKGDVDKLVEATKEKVDTELKSIIEAAMKKVTDAIEGLSKEIVGSTSEAAGKRAAIEPIFEELEKLLEPLHLHIGNVRQAADEAGVAWSG